MNIHKNARSTPLGRERLIVLIDSGLTFAHDASVFGLTTAGGEIDVGCLCDPTDRGPNDRIAPGPKTKQVPAGRIPAPGSERQGETDGS
jgi:hypothetical protein